MWLKNLQRTRHTKSTLGIKPTTFSQRSPRANKNLHCRFNLEPLMLFSLRCGDVSAECRLTGLVGRSGVSGSSGVSRQESSSSGNTSSSSSSPTSTNTHQIRLCSDERTLSSAWLRGSSNWVSAAAALSHLRHGVSAGSPEPPGRCPSSPAWSRSSDLPDFSLQRQQQ